LVGKLARYGVGKAATLKKIENVPYSREQANVFNCHSAISDILTAAEKALVSLIGGKPGVGLDALRYQRYFEKLQQRPDFTACASTFK